MSPARLLLAALVALPIVVSTQAETVVLIPTGAIWNYNDSGTDLGTGWRASSYNDSTWLSGPAEHGYGDGDETTVLSYGSSATNKRITYYFRRAFTVVDKDSLEALSVRSLVDDGAVIYLNGVEVSRLNMPAGTITYTTLAPTSSEEGIWVETTVDPALLVNGTNVLAVEVHQQSATSSDVSFNLELRATTTPPAAPSVTLESPAMNGVSNSTSVVFQASATSQVGLASATLYLGGPPKTVSFSGAALVEDAQITADTPTTANGAATSLNVDGQTPHAHALIKVPTLIGAGTGQVPAGAIVTSATLQLNCTNAGHVMSVYRLTEGWVENQATWNQRQTGAAWASAGADGPGSNAQVPVAGDCTTTGVRLINVTRFVQEWASGAANFGLVLTDSGTDGIDFSSSETGSGPTLTVTFKDTQVPVATSSLTGTAAAIQFPRTLAVGATYYWNTLVTDTLGRSSFAASDFAVTVDAAAPDEPVLIGPANGSTNAPLTPALEAFVSTPGGGALTATVSIRKAADPEFTLIVLPDTQHYSEAFPAVFMSQTQWIVDNKTARNIVFVTHEGDIVEHAGTVLEWQRASTSMSLLDGVVPYGMGPGNHDQPTTLYNQYFPYTRYQGLPWYGGHYGSLNDNNFQLFSAGRMKFVIVHLEFCPPTAAVTWASSVLQAHPDRIGIMTTHGYLNEAGQRTVHGCTNTQYLWDGLAVPNPNLHFMFSGHVHDESRRSDVVHGHPVFQMLADYQDRASGGEGWLRIVRFVPAEDKIYVQTYSPWLNRFETDANSEFTLDFPMGGAFANAGTVSVSSEQVASVTAPALEPGTTYEWRMTVTNSDGKSRTSPTWTFTTAAGAVNLAPTASGQSVTLNEDTPTAVTVSGDDPEGAPLTFALAQGPSNGILTGTLPNVTYSPAANYSGSDSFAFTVSDGVSTSAPATVSLNVQSVNDVPVAAANSYSVTGGTTLTVAAPGVLGNDQDPDNATLTAELVTTAASGTLALSANGSFTYTPNGGFTGADAFSYRASDGISSSAPVTVTLNVVAPAPLTIFTANFNSGQDSFSYVDDPFRGTNQSAYATGSRISSGSYSGGGLRVYVGGVNSTLINGMSGGWRRTFTLSASRQVVLSFRYNLDQGAEYESDELSQVLVTLGGTLVSDATTRDYVAQVVGNGSGGSSIGTGWRLVQIPLGTLPAGTHTLTIGGYNNKKNSSSERTTVLIDDVSVVAP